MDSPATAARYRHQACDPCRKRKIRCLRGTPCARCRRLRLCCEYSPVKPLGRPRQHRDFDIPSPANAAPIGGDTSPDANVLNMDRSEPLAEIFTSVPLLTPGLSTATSAAAPPWPDLHFGESMSPDHSHVERHSYSLSGDSHSTGNWLGDPGSSLSLQWATATCNCMEQVHSQLSAIAKAAANLHSIKTLRQSTDVAERVLRCTVCFNTSWRPSEASGNVLLLGSLLSAIATCYSNVFAHQRQQAADSTQAASPIRLFLGHAAEESSLVELSLSGQDYRRLLGSGFRSEFDRLSNLCQHFTTRQRRIHENGHEQCREEVPCKIVPETGAGGHPANACPKNAGARASFTCLRTAEQVRSVIGDMQKALVSDT